ncbi:D-alanyl-D-alanine carboxypeptidase family protein [Spirilliplanes yamanashiensis]|nr:D-alanyl-D-alanine carboxypeptidase family protein [Spirilliplanes yamanashiensis]MDP9818847.1 D-alanyl-D-alanine carboxypeptidase (penicillin-binding protein 5/6) [Spirilliplanes yamanashiensis]
MTRRLAATTAAAALAFALPAATPVHASAAPAVVPAVAPAVAPAAPAPAAALRADVPCPRVKANPLPSRPPKPRPPAADPVLRQVGGAGLDTDGLVVPEGAPAPPKLTAASWLVADLDTGAVLGGCGPHVRGTPASVQKLLLAATVMPRLDPDRKVTVTREDLAFEPGSSAVGLLEGGRYTVQTLWLGLLLQSGNDAANVLARLGGGDGGLPATIDAMNAEARRLGAFQTHAVTPSGLDGPGQFTSAYDLALIARACFAVDGFQDYALTRNTQIPAQPQKKKGGFQIQNENKLVFNYPGALGGKTGFTQLARHTYVGAAERDGRRLVATVLGAEARPLRGWEQGAALLDWGFSLPADARVGELVPPGTNDEPATGATASEPPAGSTPLRAPAAASSATSFTLHPAAMAAVAAALAAAPLSLLLLNRRRRYGRRPRFRRAVR